MAASTKAELLARVAELYDRDCAAVEDLVRYAATDSVQTAPIDDNVGDLEERRTIILDFVTGCNNRGFSNLTVTSISIFLLSPIDQLRRQIADANASSAAFYFTHRLCTSDAGTVIRSFLAKGKTTGTPGSSAASSPSMTTKTTSGLGVAETSKGSSPHSSSPLKASPMAVPTSPTASKTKRKAASPAGGSPVRKKTSGTAVPSTPMATTTASPSTPPTHSPNTNANINAKSRKHSATAAAYRRDSNVCVLSRYGYPDGAHIFPFSASKDRAATSQMLLLLESFWGREATAVWQAQCENAGVTESPKNILCLAKHLHALWRAARFGLKPLRDPRAAEKNEVWLQFHWLQQGPLKPHDNVDEATVSQVVDQLAARGSITNDGEGGTDTDASQRGRNGTLAHRQGGLRIRTGQVFVIAAADPEDLPSLDLLELRWNLVRVAAMSGAADVYTSGSGDDGSTSGFLNEVQICDDDDVDSLLLSEDGVCDA